MEMMVERIKNAFYQVATLGVLGSHPVGGLVASLLAFPFIILGRMMYVFSVDLFYNLFLISILSLLGLLSFVLQALPFDRRSFIVINRVIGVFAAFYYVPFQLRFILLALLLFHSLRTTLPFVLEQWWGIRFEEYSGLFGLLALDITTGFVTNVFLHAFCLLLG